MICPNCGKDNIDTNKECQYCYTKLTKHYNNQNNKKIPKQIKLIIYLIIFTILIPGLLLGTLPLGISLYHMIKEDNHSEGYKETIGYLKEYTDCYLDEGTKYCKAIYEYQVDGITYTVSPKIISDSYNKTQVVYYNPNNPSESVIHTNWNNLILISILIVCIFSIPNITIIITLVFRIIKNNKHNKKYNY